MTSVYLLQHYISQPINGTQTAPETLGIFSDYTKAWDCLENHAFNIGKTLEMSVADMGFILFDEESPEDYYMGGYSLEKYTLDEVLELS